MARVLIVRMGCLSSESGSESESKSDGEIRLGRDKIERRFFKRGVCDGFSGSCFFSLVLTILSLSLSLPHSGLK